MSTSRTPLPDGTPDLVVLSHLRWDWVWQRPQHLVTRFAALRAAGVARTWFVEEPAPADVDAPRLRTAEAGPVTRVWLDVPRALGEGPHGYDLPEAAGYGSLVARVLAEAARPAGPDVLVYTAHALDLEEFGGLVHLADDAAGFARACRAALGDDTAVRDRRLAPVPRRREWDWIAGEMHRVLAGDPALSGPSGARAGVA